MKMRHVLIASTLALAVTAAPAAFAAAPTAGTASHPASKATSHAHGGYRNYTQAQIKRLQQALTAKGFAVAATGVWNQDTRDAIKAFQKKNNLKVTGNPNAETRKALGLDW